MIEFGDVQINAAEFGSQGSAVLGIRDSGKTYTATWLAEQLFDAGIPFIAFDPIGVWRFLRVPGSGKGYPVVVAGGQEGDLPLSPASAPMIVEAAMQNGVSLVIDLFDINLSKADWRAIVRDCVRLLLHRNKDFGLRHVFLEEAAEFAPQKVLDGLVYAEIEKLARMGGNSRLGFTLINQRAQEVNKAVLELCENLFLHRQKGKNALDSLRKWLELAGASGGEVMRTLPTLPQGECWAWLGGSDTPFHLEVPHKSSLHPDRRLMHGDAAAVAKKAVSVGKFVAALTKTLPKLEEEAKANDPKALRAEIVQLKHKLAAAERTNAPAWPDQRDEVSRLRQDLSMSTSYAETLGGQIAAVAKAIGASLTAAAIPSEAAKKIALHETQALPVRHLTESKQPRSSLHYGVDYSQKKAGGASPRGGDGVANEMNGTVPSGCAKPLAVLAGAYPAGLTESQWSSAAGYKRTGGTWKEYRSRLKRAVMIEERGGLWYATELGAQSAGDVELPPSPGPDLARWWAPKVNTPARVVETLIDAWPSPLGREDLAERLDMAAGGGSFKEYLSRLKRNEIAVETSEGIRLADAIMGA